MYMGLEGVLDPHGERVIRTHGTNQSKMCTSVRRTPQDGG